MRKAHWSAFPAIYICEGFLHDAYDEILYGHWWNFLEDARMTTYICLN